MLKTEEKYRILVVDSDIGFLERISTILKDLVKSEEANVICEPGIKNIDKLVQKRIDIAFLDDRVFTNGTLLSGLYNKNPDCLIILMISEKGGYNIKEIIKPFENHNQVFMGQHILKDNYPDYIIKVICKKYLQKVIHSN
jgi:two-component SAPR family response regulator